ncbi:hypothetical protein AVEN_49406-1 [Araneus ventricosus]|uniref:Integrase catalytic domain-containing protein n=1 Tax=Araneus ventricosus TaxID=182803 RepID=A0A4Y2CQS0_ARAVE|nr:hypothetical protein AVEN_49406-1 [Araneus ventricosus]
MSKTVLIVPDPKPQTKNLLVATNSSASTKIRNHSNRFFGPLPESKNKKKWIFIVEDVATRWVELFALTNATARECATVLMEEIFLRFGLPRRVISDNGTQFVSAVIQQMCYLLKIHQSFIPVYHPQANPVERKNRDLKQRLAILVETNMTYVPYIIKIE